MKRQTLITAIVSAFVASVMVAPAAKAAAKPDLVVKSGDFYRVTDDADEVTWFLRGEQYFLKWEAKIKNIGTKAAPASEAQLFAKRNGKWSYLDDRLVPKIPAGQTKQIKASFAKTFGPSNWPYGKYPLRICADVGNQIAESKEGNNCRLLKPFYIVPGTFDGTVSGDYGGETWQGSVHLDLTEYGGKDDPNEGWFYYTVDEESGLDYAVSGEFHGCTYTGSGHIQPVHHDNLGDTLEMNFKSGKYDLYDRLPYLSTYPVWVECPGQEPGEGVGPVATDEWIRSGYTFRGFDNPGFTALAGQFTVDIEPDVNYSWNLLPDAP